MKSSKILNKDFDIVVASPGCLHITITLYICILYFKVQPSLVKGEQLDETKPMMIYNKDKSFMGYIPKKGNKEVHQALIKAVREHGWRGIKAYFYVIIKTLSPGNNNDSVIKINPTRVLPVEAW